MTPLRHPKDICQVRGCLRLRASHHPRCQFHHDLYIRTGKASGTTLDGSIRRPYVAACLAVLRRKVKECDASTIQLLYDLTALLKFRIDRHLKLGDWRALKPQAKAQCLLLYAHKRFPEGEDAALFLTATILGVALCCRVEPGVDRSEIYCQYAITRSIGALTKPDTFTAIHEVNGKTTTHTFRTKKPRLPTGKNIVRHMHTLIVTPTLRYQHEAGSSFEQAVLQHLLDHPSPQRGIRLYQTRKKNPCPSPVTPSNSPATVPDKPQ